MINEIIEINTDNLEPMKADSDDLWYNRQQFYSEKRKLTGNIKVTICVQAYNEIEKLRYSLECILKYTPEDLYELILIDNGSEPEVMELYISVNHPRVKIIRITKNISSAFPQQFFIPHINGEYTVWAFSDTYVTKNWLENLLVCMDSDKKIGIAVPLSSYTQPNQSINDLNYKTKDEIQEFALNFNVSDRNKWTQHMRVATLVPIVRSEIWYTVGIFDAGFYHELGDDDFCFRIRRAGYKVYLCRDTFVYHDAFKVMMSNEKKNDACESGLKIFMDKWKVDSWEDFLNNIPHNGHLTVLSRFNNANLLCIDPKLGWPILVISNHIKALEGNVQKSCALTSEAKFYPDLTTIADETKIGQADDLRQFYDDNSFDIICLCRPLNTYSNPLQLLKNMTLLLKSKGVLFFHINNLFDIGTLLECFSISSSNISVKKGINLTEKNCEDVLEDCGCSSTKKAVELMKSDDDIDIFLTHIFQTAYSTVGIPFDDIAINNAKIAKYHFVAVKD